MKTETRIAREILQTVRALSADLNDRGREIEQVNRDWIHTIGRLVGDLKSVGLKDEARELTKKVREAESALAQVGLAAYVYGPKLEAAKKQGMIYRDWEKAVLQILAKTYKLEKNDIFEEKQFESGYLSGDSPQRFTKWLAIKYDLDDGDEW